MTRTYGWMCLALAITAGVAFITAATPAVREVVYQPGVLIVLLIAELALVWGVSAAISRLSAGAATALFVLYAALNGLTLSIIFLVYTSASIVSTFLVTAGTFGAMAAYGHFTKKDLTSLGNLCFMALIGIIIASIVNLFVASSAFYWFLTYACILVFVGLTAYDAQKIKQMAYAADGESAEVLQKGAVMGALALYLDFINLFLLLLRLLGRRD